MKRVVFMMVLVAALGTWGATALKGKLRNTDAVVISEDDAAALAALAVERAERIESERLLDLARSAGDAAGRDAHALNSNRIAAVQGALLSSNAVRQAEMVLNSNRITAVQGAMLSSNAVFSAGITANSNRLDVAQTNMVEKLWSNATGYMDGAGVMREIVKTPISYMCTAAPYETALVDKVFLFESENTYVFGIYRFAFYVNSENWVLSKIVNNSPTVLYDTKDGGHANNEETITAFDYKTGVKPITFELLEYSYTTNVISRAATTNELAAAIAEIPLPPANATAGWLLYDAGSNMWLRVSVSNLSFTVEEVL